MPSYQLRAYSITANILLESNCSVIIIFCTGICVSLVSESYTVYEDDGSVEVCVTITAGSIASDYSGPLAFVSLTVAPFDPVEATGDHGNNA